MIQHSNYSNLITVWSVKLDIFFLHPLTVMTSKTHPVWWWKMKHGRQLFKG